MKTMTEQAHEYDPQLKSPRGLRAAPKRMRDRVFAHVAVSGRERGAVAVEMAIVLPILVALTFGIVEFSSAYHDRSAAADAARAGARVGSALPAKPTMASSVVQSVNAALSTMPRNAPQELWIYKANSAGYPGGSSSFSSCSTNCIKYTWSSGARAFTGGSGGGWPAAAQQACTQPFDQIGVYVKLNHAFVTGLFGSNVTLTDHAVFRFEPQPATEC